MKILLRLRNLSYIEAIYQLTKLTTRRLTSSPTSTTKVLAKLNKNGNWELGIGNWQLVIGNW
ncbi:hypothetical protein [Rivularia sp. UHCC 0363]|uniref:hypothetical protein n=1 Tax=Rivularia sp. UHCC 0363 TaxID=3110244 RepID=UPI002B1FF774|nr:hypothetical protein [Rivularia sp. UHCC 0363]MEA5596338.1 hypothetical protein [Rivularia sp. UHCC 0363]